MKNYIIAGLIAGIISAIVDIILSIGGLFELFSTTSNLPPVSAQVLAQIEISWFIIWGIIYGALYAFLYDHIPSEGIRKGLVFGLIIWIIMILRNVVVLASYGFVLWTIPWAITTIISNWIVYGALIGYLYKK